MILVDMRVLRLPRVLSGFTQSAAGVDFKEQAVDSSQTRLVRLLGPQERFMLVPKSANTESTEFSNLDLEQVLLRWINSLSEYTGIKRQA